MQLRREREASSWVTVRTILFLLAMVLGLPLAGAGSAAAQDTDETQGISDKEVVIVSCLPFSSTIKQLAVDTLSGAKAYIDYINAQGGVHGRKIKLISLDDGYEPEKAIQCFAKLHTEYKAFAGAFFCGSATAAKYVPMSEPRKIPMVGFLTGTDLLHDPFRPHTISVRTSYHDESVALTEKLWSLGYRKIAVAYQNDAFGVANLRGIKDALAKHKAEPVATAGFKRNVEDMSEPFKVIRAANPDAVYIAGVYLALSRFAKDCADADWHPFLVSGSYVGNEELIRLAGKAADGIVLANVVPSPSRTDLRTVALYQKVLKQFAPNDRPTFTGLEGFMDAWVVVEGLKRAGKDLTRSKFIKAIESIHNQDVGLGPDFKISYSHEDHKGLDGVCYTIIKNGKSVEVTNWSELNKH
jgi:branched-chain amino acid transport system substrate-binding protein